MRSWPDRIDLPLEEFLTTGGRVVRRFGGRTDSRSTVLGVEIEDGRFIIKHAVDDEAVAWLESAVRFHSAVSHPVIAGVVHHFRTPDGLALVERWAPGQVLVDHFDPDVPGRDDPRSPYQRFLRLPVAQITDAVGSLIAAHLSVVAAGFVAVDLYDGCLVYDFDACEMSLIDLDMYRPGPFVLEVDRQYGSSAFMAPEEWQQGAIIDEQTTVFTLGRFALVLLGCHRDGPPERTAFRGSDQQFEVALRACAPEPTERLHSVAEFSDRWTAAAHP